MQIIMSARQKCSGGTCCLCSGKLYGRQHPHMERLSSDLQEFVFAASVLNEMR